MGRAAVRGWSGREVIVTGDGPAFRAAVLLAAAVWMLGSGAAVGNAGGSSPGKDAAAEAPAAATPDDDEEARRLPGAREKVTVTATRLPARAEELRRVPAAARIFTREEIEASGARTLQEFLEGHASFHVFDQVGNPAQATVSLRGFGADSALALMVDGVRVNEPDDNRAAFDLVPLADVDRIEVLPGGYSSMFGGGTLAGVIHVITRGGAGAAPLQVEARAGSYGADALAVSTGGSEGRLSWYASAGRVTSSGYRESATSHMVSARGRLAWRLDEGHSLDLSYQHAANDIGAGGALTAEEIEQDRRQNLYNRPDHERPDLDLAALEYRGELSAGFDFRALLSLRSNDVETLTTGRTAATFGSGFRTDTTYDTVGLAVQAGHAAGQGALRSSLAFGAEVRDSGFGSDGFLTDPVGQAPQRVTVNDTDERVAGLFANETLDLGPRWSLSAGVRFDETRLEFRQEDTFSGSSRGKTRFRQWSPRAGVTFRPDARTRLFASAGRAFLAPTVNQLFAFVGFGSNPDLEPQSSTGYEAGFEREIGGSTILRGALFRIDVSDEIQFVYTDPAFFLGQNENVGRTRRQGIEMEVTAAMGPRVRGTLEASWIDAEFRDGVDRNGDGAVTAGPDPFTGIRDIPAGVRLTLVPRYKASATLTVDLGGGWAIDLRDAYVADQRLDGDEAGVASEVPPYNVLDLGVRYGRGRWEAFARARNLLDRQYATRGITNGLQEFFTPALERSLEAGVRFRL